jgi:hypothetical protein
MGSAAMDHSGDIAIGYSASGPNYFPSLHYAGRLSNDPLGVLTQGEAVMFAGQGIEVNTGIFPFRNRWGDYSALQVDPVDDCTFWYTNEYNATNPPIDPNNLGTILPVDWQTRIGSFKFPQCVTPVVPQLINAASEKVHGSAGTFDVDLPLTGTRGVECRSGGTQGDFTIIFNFNTPVASCGTASTSNGSVSSGGLASGNSCTVNITNIPNAQYTTITLTGVVSSTGGVGNASATMGVLLGDVNASGRVDAADVSSVRQQTLQSITSSNFRNDLNTSGRIDAADVSVARQQTLTSLPSSP